jgi:hypothetical protein
MKTAWFALPAVALLVVACNEPTTPLAARSDQSSLGSILASAQGNNAVIHQVSVGGSDQDVTRTPTPTSRWSPCRRRMDPCKANGVISSARARAACTST